MHLFLENASHRFYFDRNIKTRHGSYSRYLRDSLLENSSDSGHSLYSLQVCVFLIKMRQDPDQRLNTAQLQEIRSNIDIGVEFGDLFGGDELPNPFQTIDLAGTTVGPGTF